MNRGAYNIRMLPTLLFVALMAASPEQSIRQVMETQQDAWNRGDVDAFMSGYEAREKTTFVGNAITRGYQPVLENYRKRYPTKEKMGQLTFSDLEIQMLGTDYASVLGRWKLARSADAGGNIGGIYTLLFRKTANGWKIILDHTGQTN